MPTEPEHDIEKTLKAYAQRRRDAAGAPLELPAHARARLQREAARLNAKPSGSGGFWEGLMAALRPRLAYASILLLLAAVCAGLFLPRLSRDKMELAGNENSLSQRRLAPKLGDEKTESFSKDVSAPAAPPPSAAAAPAGQAGSRSISPPAFVPPPIVANQPEPSALSDAEKGKATKSLPVDRALTGAAAVKTPAPVMVTQALALPPPVVPSPPPVSSANAVTSEGRSAGQAKTQATVALNFRSPETAPNAQTGEVGIYSLAGGGGGRRRGGGGGVGGGGGSAGAGGAFRGGAGSAVTTETAQTTVELASRNQPVAAPVATTNGQMAGDARSSQTLLTQQFFRLGARGRLQTPSAPPSNLNGVLNSFRVELNGGQMRIIDADGSVYSGIARQTNAGLGLSSDAVAAPTPPGSTAAAPRQTLLRNSTAVNGVTNNPAASEGQPPQNYSFQVTGTSLTLNQLVVFSGNFLQGQSAAATPAAGGGRGGAGGGGGRGGSSSGCVGVASDSIPNSWPRHIGGTNALQVNATPSGR